MDEEWRLAYVALTRARRFAGITHASRRDWYGRWQARTPSNFLQALPANAVASFAPNAAKPYYSGQSKFRATARGIFTKRKAYEAPAPTFSAAPTRADASGRGAARGGVTPSPGGRHRGQGAEEEEEEEEEEQRVEEEKAKAEERAVAEESSRGGGGGGGGSSGGGGGDGGGG